MLLSQGLCKSGRVSADKQEVRVNMPAAPFVLYRGGSAE
jgi:hypothetical protein